MPETSDFSYVLLDMNQTFMFGDDRFGNGEDFESVYRSLGGKESMGWVEERIRAAFDYLEIRYPDPAFHDRFPSVADAFQETSDVPLTDSERGILVDTFARFEIGNIPAEYAEAVRCLSSQFSLGLVADIWAPSDIWRAAFVEAEILDCFDALSFSCDIAMVKPAPEPFLGVLSKLGATAEEAVFVGDSARRDLGGARKAGIECVLVGGAEHVDALATYPTFLDFVDATVDPGRRGLRSRQSP